MPKILTSQDLLTMIVHRQSLKDIWFVDFDKTYNDGTMLLQKVDTSLLLTNVFQPSIIILDISNEEAKPAKNGLLSKEALTFLGSCNYITRPHNERQALIAMAKTLYPNTSTEEGETL